MRYLNRLFVAALALLLLTLALPARFVEAQVTNRVQNVTNLIANTATSYLTVRFTDGTNFLTASQDATHDSAALSVGPQMTAEAASDISANTAVADGDAVRSAADLLGRLITAGRCDRGARVRSVTAVTDGSSTSAIAAGGAGIYLEVTDVIVSNTSATPVTLDLRDGTAGSVIATFPVPESTSGVVMSLQTPITGSANTAMAVDPSAAASTITVTLVGCKVK